MYATSAFERPSENVSYENLLDNSSELKENPMSLKFNSLEIEDETTKRSINFFDLPQEQKEVFTDLLLMEEAKSMTAKIEAAPALKEILLKENLATSRVIEREGLKVSDRIHKLEYQFSEDNGLLILKELNTPNKEVMIWKRRR